MSDNPLSLDDPQAKLIPPETTSPVAAGVAPAEETPAVAAQGPIDQPVSLPGTSAKFDEMAKQEFLWHTHQYLGEYARFADTKAAFAGTLAAALLGGLYGAKLHVAIGQSGYAEWPLFAWLAALGGVFLIGAVVLAVWTVLPRLGSTQSKGFVYWGSIAAHGSVESLQTSFHSQSARTLNDHLLHHVFDISSKVCIPKYRCIALCIWALVIGGCMAATAMVLQDNAQKAASARPSAPVAAPLSPSRTAGR